jgi:hypothetical protein
MTGRVATRAAAISGLVLLVASEILSPYSYAYREIVTLTIPEHCAAGARCLSAAVGTVYLHHPNWSQITQGAGLALLLLAGLAFWLCIKREATS